MVGSRGRPRCPLACKQQQRMAVCEVYILSTLKSEVDAWAWACCVCADSATGSSAVLLNPIHTCNVHSTQQIAH